jgi:hypothetical protein
MNSLPSTTSPLSSDPRDAASRSAWLDGSQGHSFFLYLHFSLVFFPAALIVAYVVPDRTAMMTA